MRVILFVLIYFSTTICFLLNGQDFQLNELFSEKLSMQFTNGLAVADFNQDGLLDLYIVSREAFDKDKPETWNRLLRNVGNGFIDETEKASLHIQFSDDKYAEEGIKMGASWGDYNNDGYPDLFLTNYGKDQLWRNKGDGTFEDISQKAKIEGSSDNYSSSALWWDYDNDGDLDLYVSSWQGKNRLYRNDWNDVFTDVSAQSNLEEVGRTWTSIPFDINKDGWQDIYIVNDFGENFLYQNDTKGGFIEKTRAYGLRDIGEGMGVDICDYHNDGNFDIYLTNIWQTHQNPFFVNDGEKFTNQARLVNLGNTGWAWGIRFFDLEHDMDEDMYVVNQRFFEGGNPESNKLFIKTEAGFEEKGRIYGVDNQTDARGLEVFDFNRDGDLDLFIGPWGGKPILYENRIIAKGNWLKIQLQGTESNRDALGAVVRIKTGTQLQHRLHHGANYLGQSIKPLHFGLSGHEMIEEISIYWPSGRVEKLIDIAANQTLLIIEGAQPAVEEPIYGTPPELSTNTKEILQTKLGFQITPNPVTTTARLTFNSNRKQKVRMRITDVLGKTYYEASFLLPNGQHEKKLPLDLISANGVYYLSVITDNAIRTESFIRNIKKNN
jgi:hypothetical protein